MGSVFTKNRFVDESGAQSFFHQFGIGYAVTGGLGYQFKPWSGDTQLQFTALWQQYGTRVEVNGIGDDQWRFGSLQVGVGVLF